MVEDNVPKGTYPLEEAEGTAEGGTKFSPYHMPTNNRTVDVRYLSCRIRHDSDVPSFL